MDLYALTRRPIRTGDVVEVEGRPGEWRVVSRAAETALLEHCDTRRRERVPVAMLERGRTPNARG